MRTYYNIILIIVSVMMIFSMVSCINDEPQTETFQTESSELEESSDISSYLPQTYPAVEGMTVNILTRDGTSPYWGVMDLKQISESDVYVYDAAYERYKYLQEKYGFKINQIFDEITPYSAAVIQIKNINRAGVEAYHVVALNAMQTAGPLAMNNELVDLKTISTLDLDQEFWNQSFIENMTVGGKLFSVVGDLSVTYYDHTWLQLFNKDILAEKGIDESIGNPYEFIENGTWTIDVMKRMATLAKDDLNKDGKMTEEDMYGYVYSPFNNYALYCAGGNSIISKDENDLPVLTVNAPKTIETVTKIKEMISDTSVSRCGDEETNISIFHDGRALFVNATMNDIYYRYRTMRPAFGVAPNPKADESQSEYINPVSSDATVFAIPVSCQRREEVGFILNALSYQSQETLVPAYFKTTVSLITRDKESDKLLPTILKSASFDLSLMYDVGWMSPLTNEMASLDVASKYDELKRSSESIIKEIINIASKKE